jgi:hypothetical protein
VTSRTPKSPSTEAHEEQDTDSVFDFLYYDATRVASLLSQFSQSGHLTGVTQSEGVDRRTNDTAQVGAKGGFAPLAQGEGSVKWDNYEGLSRGSIRTYDPRWVNALEFLDFSDERGIIQSDIEAARMGHIVLFSGSLAIFDLKILKNMWAQPAIKKAILAGGAETATSLGKPARNPKAQRVSGMKDAEVAVELVSILPHGTAGSLTSSDEQVSVWFTLNESGMAVPTPDLFLKHGFTIPGDWSVVGILDAYPDEGEDVGLGYYLNQLLAGNRINGISHFMAAFLTGPVRQMFGRPMGSYGVTPLLIFRQIAK